MTMILNLSITGRHVLLFAILVALSAAIVFFADRTLAQNEGSDPEFIPHATACVNTFGWVRIIDPDGGTEETNNLLELLGFNSTECKPGERHLLIASEEKVDEVIADIETLTSEVAQIGPSPQVIGGATILRSGTNTQFVPLFADFTTGRHSTMPISGTVSDFYVSLTGEPGVGDSYTLEVVRNGLPSALGCTITDLEQTCSNLVESLCYEVGDGFLIRATADVEFDDVPLTWTAAFTPGPCEP